jgi:integrase/recombinase XerD
METENHTPLPKRFKEHLQRLGYSKTSLLMLPNCLADFLEYTANSSKKITSEDILNYYKHLQERPNKTRAGGLSESYINHHIYALKLFFAWQIEIKELTTNPISSLEFTSPTSKQRDVLTQKEVYTLYKATIDYKEKATLSIFYGCGLRRSEGEQLDLRDVHFNKNLLYVRKGKNSKRRAVPLAPKVKRDLENYVYNERSASAQTTALITNTIGTRSRGSSFNLTLKTILNRTEITKEISLHNLRHSIATHLLESGLSVEYVRDFLGHKHLESTQIYTRVTTEL